MRIRYPRPKTQKVNYFWGYRHHALVDLESELPLWSLTEPCSVGEVTLAVPLLDAPAFTFGLCYKSGYGDAEKILRHIQDTLKANAYIPYNPRRATDKEGFELIKDRVFCPARLQMYRNGKMTVKGMTYIQYRCIAVLSTRVPNPIC